MATMRSQSGTFYKIIVTLLLLGVNHLSLSTSSHVRGKGADCGANNNEAISKSLPVVPSGSSENEPVASASTLTEAITTLSGAMAALFEKDGAISKLSTGVSNSSGGGGPTDSLNSIIKEEGNKLVSAVVPQEQPKETLQTAAQSYFIEPEQSTTTTQKPTFTKRKTRRPISALTEHKKKNPAADADKAVNNEIPQGNPVPFNPFRQIVNTSFGKSRSSSGKLTRSRFSRPNNNAGQQPTASSSDTKLNEIPASSTTEGGEPRPSFTRRRPVQRPSSSNNETDSAAAAPEAPKTRRFPLRRPVPVGNDESKSSKNDNQGADRPRPFRRSRPAGNSTLIGSKPEISLSGVPEGRRIRPIRPLIHSRLTSPNPTTTVITTTEVPITTVIGEANPSPSHEGSPIEDILGLSGLQHDGERPTSTSFPGLPISPFQEMPDHLNNIFNGIGPIPVIPGSKPIGINQPIVLKSPFEPLRPSLRSETETDGRQGFILRPRSSTQSPNDGDNEVTTRPQIRRRKRPTDATTETPEGSNNQRFVGGIIRSRIPSSSTSNERNPPAIRSGIQRNPVPASPVRSRGRIVIPDSPNPSNPENNDETPVQGGVVTPDIIGNERIPIRGGRLNNVPQRNPDTSSTPVRGGVVIQDLRGNEEVRARGSRVNGGLQQRIPINLSSPPVQANRPIPNLPESEEDLPVRGGRNRNTGQQNNHQSSVPFRGGIVSSDLTVDNHGVIGNSPPLRRIPSIVQQNPNHNSVSTNIPFPPLNLPSYSSSHYPQSYQIRDDPMMQPLPIPRFKPMPEPDKLSPSLLQAQPLRSIPPSPQVIQNQPQSYRPNLSSPQVIQNQQPYRPSLSSPEVQQYQSQPYRPIPAPSPVVPRQPQSLRSIPNSSPVSQPQSYRPIPVTPLPYPSVVSGSLSSSSGIPDSRVRSSSSALAAPIQQTLNTALNPNANNYARPAGLFQVPPQENLGFYPGLDNVLGMNGKGIQRKSDTADFSSRTTSIPEELEISYNPSASNDNQAVVESDPSYSQESIPETNQPQPDPTTVTTTSTTTVATPTKRLSPLQKLQQNRQAAARKFLTPRKPMEKQTTLAPENNSPASNFRKSVIPPRTLRSRGKSLQPEENNASQQEHVNGNESDVIINESTSSSSEPDTASNVVPISPDQAGVELETSSRKPSILEKAKRRRIPLPQKSSISPVQQFQAHMMGRNVSGSNSQPSQETVVEATAAPTCEDGERYNKFLKRCVATYKPRVQG